MGSGLGGRLGGDNGGTLTRTGSGGGDSGGADGSVLNGDGGSFGEDTRSEVGRICTAFIRAASGSIAGL